MKQLKSFSHDLYELFTQNITVREIAEPLASFDDEACAIPVAQFMSKKDFDHIGVRRNGMVVGYAVKTDLKAGKLRDHLAPFQSDDVIPVGAPLLDALEALKPPAIPELTPRVFVTTWDKVGGIVTFGDLQKAPVRMWLFGLISLVEMQMLRIIRAGYPNNSWQTEISEDRLEAAREILADRQTRNEAVDLAYCLQFCDKRDLIVGNSDLRQRLGVTSRARLEHLLRDLEHLRDDLAHAQDILASRRSTLLPLARQTADLLQKWEGIKIGAEGVSAH
jgi:hypothetical protein